VKFILSDTNITFPKSHLGRSSSLINTSKKSAEFTNRITLLLSFYGSYFVYMQKNLSNCRGFLTGLG